MDTINHFTLRDFPEAEFIIRIDCDYCQGPGKSPRNCEVSCVKCNGYGKIDVAVPFQDIIYVIKS